ncbi:hypothetical protein E4U58_000869 [Claviceps cyperi]|nr:hypothetical protein E4U58_000869 [Claviceps cyperi]
MEDDDVPTPQPSPPTPKNDDITRKDDSPTSDQRKITLDTQQYPSPDAATTEPDIEGYPDEMDTSDMALLFRMLCYKAQQNRKDRREENSSNPSEPRTWKQAKASPQRKEWLKAIYSEFKQWLQSGTFEFLGADQVPRGRRVLRNKLGRHPQCRRKTGGQINRWRLDESSVSRIEPG